MHPMEDADLRFCHS